MRGDHSSFRSNITDYTLHNPSCARDMRPESGSMHQERLDRRQPDWKLTDANRTQSRRLKFINFLHEDVRPAHGQRVNKYLLRCNNSLQAVLHGLLILIGSFKDHLTEGMSA